MFHLIWLNQGEPACGITNAARGGDGVINIMTRATTALQRSLLDSMWASGTICPECEQVYRDEFGGEDAEA